MSTVFAYLPVRHFGFVNYDDGDYVFVNSHVNSGLTWSNVRWSLTGFASGNWHPVTWLSHALDCQLFGLNAGPHHAVSLSLHVANVLLVFLLLWKVTGRRVAALCVAGLFALHPFNVESVAWVAERKNLLCTLFFLLGLGAYGWYCRRPGVPRYLIVAGMFVLGLASKPMAITFPFVLFLLDYWPLGRILGWTIPDPHFPVPQRSFRDLILEKLPLLALSAASAIITLFAQRSANAVQSLSTFPLSGRLGTVIWAYGQYLWKTFWPLGLASFYPAGPLDAIQVSIAGVSLAAIAYCVWKLNRGRPYLTVGSLWFLGTLVPVIGLVQVGVQSMADRYTYIPLLGIFVALVWGVAEIADKLPSSRVLCAALTVVVFVALAWTTGKQVIYWKDSTALWSHALQVTVSNYVAEENLAVALANDGHDEKALPHFENVRAIRPDDPTALINIGMALERHGKYQEAVETFDTLIATAKDPVDQPRVVAAYRGLGIAYTALGDRRKARENFVHAVQMGGEETTDLLNLSIFEADESANKLSEELSKHPSAEGYVQLGELLKLSRNTSDAQAAYQKALRLNPKLAEARQALQELTASAN
jgi:Flp pilus assembly protein TadD